MRGTRGDVPPSDAFRGIIPAYAGNTEVAEAGADALGDHPRVCGEHGSFIGNLFAQAGSSPRMRGTLDVRGIDVQGAGIIPAYAGNTSC